MIYDLTIRGAGIFGLSIAWEATNRGAKVQIIDPNGAGSGASGGIVGALQPHTPDRWNAKKQYQLESLLMAEDFWRSVDETSGLTSGYARIGRVQPLMNERGLALATERKTDAKARWGLAASWQITRDAGAWNLPSPTGLYLHDTLSAIVNPNHATKSLVQALKSRGVPILTKAPEKGATVWATGWQGLRDLSKHFDQDIGGSEKGQAALLRCNAVGRPQVFADGLHIIPHLDGTVAVGSTSERSFDAATTTDSQLDTIVERARKTIPILQDAAILTRWAGVRPRAASRAPLLGPWPNRPNHFIANGGFKIGFGMAPKIAHTMCDLILNQNNAIPDDFLFLLGKNISG
ncbi:MAG: FAD-binding oxidoreductase [Paracoccaceae bacterium]